MNYSQYVPGLSDDDNEWSSHTTPRVEFLARDVTRHDEGEEQVKLMGST